MSEIFLFYAATLCFVVGIAALMCVYRYFLGNRLVEQSQKLKSQIAKIRQDFPELGEIRSKAVAGALGDIGIEGIMDELGIDPGLLNNPLVKGLIAKYAPRLIEQMGKKATGEKPESKETWL